MKPESFLCDPVSVFATTDQIPILIGWGWILSLRKKKRKRNRTFLDACTSLLFSSRQHREYSTMNTSGQHDNISSLQCGVTAPVQLPPAGSLSPPSSLLFFHLPFPIPGWNKSINQCPNPNGPFLLSRPFMTQTNDLCFSSRNPNRPRFLLVLLWLFHGSVIELIELIKRERHSSPHRSSHLSPDSTVCG